MLHTHTHTHTEMRMLWGNNIIIESWKWAARWRWIFSTGRQSLLCYSDDDYKTVTVVNHYIQALFSFFPFPSLLQLPVIVKYISEKSTNLMYFPQYSFFLSCFFVFVNILGICGFDTFVCLTGCWPLLKPGRLSEL